jgi:hypothetical protein
VLPKGPNPAMMTGWRRSIASASLFAFSGVPKQAVVDPQQHRGCSHAQRGDAHQHIRPVGGEDLQLVHEGKKNKGKFSDLCQAH